jgi:hypothetical protein
MVHFLPMPLYSLLQEESSGNGGAAFKRYIIYEYEPSEVKTHVKKDHTLGAR